MKKIFLLFCLPLLAAAAEVPLFTVPVSGTAPVIDGLPRADEWRNAPELGNFMRIGDNRFAAEQTQVMVSTDGRTLFFGFRFNEYALDKYSNSYKSFKAALKGKNRPVWDDDSLEMRIAPPWIKDRQFFYIAFGAGGATKVKTPKGFKGDVESQLQLAVKEHNGFWTAELAIPLKALGAGAAGEWKINFVRFEQRLPESSSYCPLQTGEHGNLGKHALMRFVPRPVPLICEQDYSKLSSLAGVPVLLKGKEWQGTWQSSCAGKLLKGKAVSPGKNSIEFPPLETGYGRAALKIGDFYRSPAYPQSKVSAKIKLRSTSGISGTLNGKKFQGKAVTLFPDDGLNRLVIALPPRGAVDVETDTEIGLPVKWNFSSSAIRSRTAAKTESFTNTSSKGQQLSTGFFQRGTKFIPPGVNRQSLQLTENGTYVFLWDILNTAGWDFNKALKQVELHLYLPDSVEFLGVDNRVKYPAGFPKLKWPADKRYYSAVNAGKKKILGAELQHWIIKRNAPVKFEYTKPLRHHQVKRDRAAIFLRGRKGTAKNSGSMAFFHMKAEGGSLGEMVQMMPVRIFPELKGGKVPDLTMSLMNYWCDDIENKNLTTPFYKTLIAAGVNEVVMDTRFAPPPELRFLARIELERINWRNTYPEFEDFLKRHPESRIINSRGWREEVVSMSHLLDHPELHHELFMVLVKLKKDHPYIAGLFIDLEEDPFNSRYGGDYSPASLRRFAAKYGISGKLTPEIIKSRYADKWIAFRGSEIGAFTGMLRPMCHRLGLYLVFYTDYDSPRAVRMYTADWKYLNGAVDLAYMGYGRDPRLIENTRKKLPDTPLVFGMLTWTNTSNFETVVHLQRLIDSKRGVLMWFARGFGAGEAMALADATRCYDHFRPYFLAGKRVDEKFPLPGMVRDEVIAFELNGKTLLLLLNNSFQERTLHLNISEKEGKALKEFFSGAVFAPGEKALLKLPPRSAAAFCGKLQFTPRGSEKSINLVRNGSFEESVRETGIPLYWRSRNDSFAARRSAEQATAGKYAAEFKGDGTKNAVLIQHLDTKAVMANPEFEISVDLFVDRLDSGMIMPIQLIVVTNENGKRKSNYPGAWIFSKNRDGMGSWVKPVKKYDLSPYRNIVAVELWSVGWSYKKNMFKGRFFVDDFRIVPKTSSKKLRK